MDREERLLDNLDEIDKHIATAAMTLFLISLFYIAILLNVSNELKVPGFDLNLPKTHALFIGCPLFLVVFQYITIAVLAMVRVEESLMAATFSPADPPLRKPTIFSMMYLARETAEARRSRFGVLVHILVVNGCLFLLPVIVCTVISIWLVKNARWYFSVVGLVCAVLCVAEIAFVSFESIRRLKSIQKQS